MSLPLKIFSSNRKPIAQPPEITNHNRPSIYQDQSEQHLVLRDGNDDQDGVVEYVDRGETIIGAVVV